MKSDSGRGLRRRSLKDTDMAGLMGDSMGDTVATPAQAPELDEPPTRSSATVLPRLASVAGQPKLVVDELPRYQDLKVLGSGGLGVVELARDNDIGRQVAVKRLLPDAASPEDLLRFAEEVRTVGLLEHPNITPIHDVGVDQRGHFFVMKHVEGVTLAEIIQQLAAGDADMHARYPFEARTRIFLGVLQALAFAHSKGVFHRDVKPANVMIGTCGEVMLMDWGLSMREGASVDPPQTIVGTPKYMAPEQARGTNPSERSDIYSASVLFYELLALRHYIPDEKTRTLFDVLDAVEGHEPTPARFVASPHQTNVPPELSWFIAKGMKKDPAERYQTVPEMIAALAAINRGEIQAQCPRTFLKRMAFRAMHFSDAHAAPSLVLTALALGVFAVGAVAAAQWLAALI